MNVPVHNGSAASLLEEHGDGDTPNPLARNTPEGSILYEGHHHGLSLGRENVDAFIGILGWELVSEGDLLHLTLAAPSSLSVLMNHCSERRVITGCLVRHS